MTTTQHTRGSSMAQDAPSDMIGRRHGENGAWIIEEHQDGDEVGHLFGMQGETFDRTAGRRRWPHFKQPIDGRRPGFRRMYCEHDIAIIAAKLEHGSR